MSHGTFLDDDPAAIQAAEEAEAKARQRAANLTPHQYAAGAIEMEALTRQLVAKGIAFGQSRLGFLTSVAHAWDTYLPAYKALVAAQKADDGAIMKQETADDGELCKRACGDRGPCRLPVGHEEPCTP